jgi:hypothetical protein
MASEPLTQRVRTAHGDAWQEEGRLRIPYGGAFMAQPFAEERAVQLRVTRAVQGEDRGAFDAVGPVQPGNRDLG